MFPKIFTRCWIASFAVLAILMVAVDVNTASGFLKEEKLYPVENFTAINPPLIFPEKPKLEANPFIPDLPEIPKISRPIENIAEFSRKFDARNLKVEILASSHELENKEVQNCKALLEQTLATIPEDLTASLDSMKLFFSKKSPRGLSNSHLVEIRCGNLEENEIISVFVHELGHITDLGGLKGASFAPSGFADGSLKIPADDPSVRFYQLSWKDEQTQKFMAKREDFVSGYAMSDPFEDFAESFNFYILHGEDFRAIKEESNILAQKYDFMRDEVFGGVEFESERSTKNGKRVWDSTLLEFDREEFFARG
ncbi:MAG: hypothetical protein ABIE14_04160 [Patescibacteria group bacterium]